MTSIAEGVDDLQLDQQDITTRDIETNFAQYAEDRPGDTVQFYELESKVLDLWDRLNDLKLEIAVVEISQHSQNHEPTVTDGDLEAEIQKAEKECLEARAEYLLRQSVVEDTIITAPTLNAVHTGIHASPTERTLKPLLNRRDALEIASANLSSSLQSILQQTRQLQVEGERAKAGNRPLAAEMLTLTKQLNDRKDRVKGQPKLDAALGKAREEADTAVRQWRIMKSVVSAIITGSGVNWAEDDVLRDLVLDAEDENE